MKEILKSKVMVIMVMFIVSVCYLNCLDNERMEQTDIRKSSEIVYNQK